MNYTKDLVMSMVADALGDNPEGVFVNYGFYSGDEDAVIYSGINKPFLVSDTKKFAVAAGATKLCIIPKNTHYDWVIKIPLTGIYTYAYMLDDIDTTTKGPGFISALEESGLDDETLIKIAEFDTDYVAEEESLEGDMFNSLAYKLLAHNFFVGMYGDIPVYVQERAEKVYACSNHSYDYQPKMSEKIMDMITSITAHTELEYGWLFDVVLYYGMMKAADMLYDIELYCSDLHNENYGYRKDGTPIIIDYGGYDRCNSWHFLPDEYIYEQLELA